MRRRSSISAGLVGAARPHKLRHELLRIANLEGICAKSLQQSNAQAHSRVADNDRLWRAPLAVGELPARDEIDFGREWRPIVEGLSDEVDEQRDIGRSDGVPTRPKHIQGVSIAEEDRRLALAYDDLRANPVITDPGLRKSVHDLVSHLVWILDDVEYSGHCRISPLRSTPIHYS